MKWFIFLDILVLAHGKQRPVNAFQGDVEISLAGSHSHMDEDAIMNVFANKVDNIGMPVDCHHGHCPHPKLNRHNLRKVPFSTKGFTSARSSLRRRSASLKRRPSSCSTSRKSLKNLHYPKKCCKTSAKTIRNNRCFQRV